jgi:hypothetical protein
MASLLGASRRQSGGADYIHGALYDYAQVSLELHEATCRRHRGRSRVSPDGRAGNQQKPPQFRTALRSFSST